MGKLKISTEFLREKERLLSARARTHAFSLSFSLTHSNVIL